MMIRRTTAMAVSLLLTTGSLAGAQTAQTMRALDSTMRVAAMFDDGPFEMTLASAQQGIVLVRVMADRAEPYRILGMQVRLGG